ncbi:MAG: CPBP family intramembrane metalloprotease [Thermoguttaceae bacterium]|nr:CPBP family intramembrane metalloprotease [Thermoguttaceae bacterium]
MKRFGCLLFLFLTLTLISLTDLAPASEISESRDFWKNFNEKTTDFSAAFEQLKQIGEKRDYRDFEIVEDVPPEKIPFEDLTEKQGSESEFWYSGAKCRVLVTKESFVFYEKTICPKLHTFLKGIASDVQAKTYTFVRNETGTIYGYTYMGFYSKQLDEDLSQLDKPAVILVQSKNYSKIVNSKKDDSIDMDVTIYILANAYGESVPYEVDWITLRKNVYTVVSYRKPDEKDKDYRPVSNQICVPSYSVSYGYKRICFSPWLNYGSTFETSPTSLYRGEDGLKAVTVSWDQKGNTSIEDAFIAEEKEIEEYNSPEKVKQREKEFKKKMEEERQKAIDSMSPKLRTFLFCYPIVVIIATIGSIAVLIYGFMEFLHPTWYWLNKFRVVWQVITIIYLGFLSCFMSYSIYYRPNQFWGIWFTCGFLFLPFIAILLLSTPEERIRNAIDDATSDPDSRLFLMFLRPILKFIIVCFFGGALLHIFFWRRSLELIFRGLFPSAEGPEE